MVTAEAGTTNKGRESPQHLVIRGDSLGQRVLGRELDDFVRGQLVAFVLIGDEPEEGWGG